MAHTMSPFTTPFAHAAFLGTFLRFMAFALKRGVPVTTFLEEFSRTQSMPERCAEALRGVAGAVRSGTALSDALSAAPDVFPSWLVAGVRAGERGGHMDRVAQHLADLQSRRCHFLRLLERDWAYPLFLTGTIVLLLGSLAVLTMPDFLDSAHAVARSHPQFGERFPLVSAALSGLAGVSALKLLVVLALGGVALAAGARGLARSPFGHRVRDLVRRGVRYLPYYGRAQQELALAGFCDCVSGLLQQGVVLQEALKLAAESVPDERLGRQLAAVARRAEAGEPVGDVLATVSALPHVFVFKLRLGIPEDALALSFADLADGCREDAEYVVRTAQAIIQPVVIVAMGALVGALWFFVFTVLFGILGVLQEA
jgi:type II secretory pathway component PulF